MLLEHIRFEKRQALRVEIKFKEDIHQALEKLGLVNKRPVIVIIGGAGGVRKEDWEPIRKALNVIAIVAQEMGAAIIDGGTNSGIMAIIGEIRSENNFNFPLIGVAAEGTVNWPGKKIGVLERFTINRESGPLDSNHTHFILVPGNEWGDESSWIAEVATQLAGELPSVAFLINGGAISREMDVPNNLNAGRTILVIEGTGRAADEFATHPLDTELMQFVHIDDPDRLANKLNKHLNSAE